jgi:lipopolysaccharide export LptBFGC system permease protein LptF
MKIKEIFKNTDLWKIILMVGILLVIVVGWFGFTVITPWGTITKDSYEKVIAHNRIKLKTQVNYAKDMKERILIDLGNLYEEKLLLYCQEKNIILNQDQISNDVKYYRVVVMAMNDACDNITVDRYILDNDLYRYTNKSDWDKFKLNTADLFIKEGKKVLINNYDNSKVIMPINAWFRLGGKELTACLIVNTDRMLEDLKIESVLYHEMKK